MTERLNQLARLGAMADTGCAKSLRAFRLLQSEINLQIIADIDARSLGFADAVEAKHELRGTK